MRRSQRSDAPRRPGLKTPVRYPSPSGRSSSSERHLEADVAVVGGGAAGLFVTQKLASLGLRVVLAERAPLLVPGPSSKNEGWLHNGSYHAISTRDPEDARQVAIRCMQGHDEIRRYAPEAVEDIGALSVALVREGTDDAAVRSRWRAAGVPFRRLAKRELARMEPGFDLSAVAASYRVADVSIDTRVLYRKLLEDARRHDVRVLTETRPIAAAAGGVRFDRGGTAVSVHARVFVYAAGFGLRDLVADLFGVRLPLRLWKSHILDAPRVARCGVFFVERGEAAVMHHGRTSIVGLNEDATPIERPDFDSIPTSVESVKDALRRLVPGADLRTAVGRACVKVDVAEGPGAARSLNVKHGQIWPGHLWVVPGKMTEAPVAAGLIVRLVSAAIPDPLVAPRPCDTAT